MNNNSVEAKVLRAILALDPKKEEEINEWAEAACFQKASKLANDCLREDIQDGDLRIAITQIAEVTPSEDSDEPNNEWGEADCFNIVRKLANTALNQLLSVELQAINKILLLDPYEEEETNEWAEAACFNKAIKIANDCLKTKVDDLELRLFITKISLINPSEDSSEPNNEWAEADCFHKAVKIAREAIKVNKKNTLKI